MNNSFRSRLRSKELLVGSVVSFNSPEVIELLSQCGYDWLWLDAEHGTYSTSDLRAMLQAAGDNVSCLIRVANSNGVEIKRALDIGPSGIIVPMVNNREQAEMIVNCAKYSPIGSRGIGIARAHGYGMKFKEYMKKANSATTIVIQIEQIKAVENIESIVQVEEIDAILVGPYDLSASMGLMGQIDHPEVVKAINQVAATSKAAGKTLGIFGLSSEDVKKYIDKGYTLIAAGIDSQMLGNAAIGMIRSIR